MEVIVKNNQVVLRDFRVRRVTFHQIYLVAAQFRVTDGVFQCGHIREVEAVALTQGVEAVLAVEELGGRADMQIFMRFQVADLCDSQRLRPFLAHDEGVIIIKAQIARHADTFGL